MGRFDPSATTNRFGQHGRWRPRPPPSNGSLPRSCHDPRAPLSRQPRSPRLRRRALALGWWRRAVRGGGWVYKSHHGGVLPCPPASGNLPGPVAGHPAYGRRPGHRTAIARRGAGGEGPGGGFPGPSCFPPSGGGTAVGGLPSRAWLPLRPHPAGSVLRLDSLRGRLWRHPGPQFMTVGSFAFAQRPLHAPPPPDVVLLSCAVFRWLRCPCGSRGADVWDAGRRLPAANKVCVMLWDDALGFCLWLSVALWCGMALRLGHVVSLNGRYIIVLVGLSFAKTRGEPGGAPVQHRLFCYCPRHPLSVLLPPSASTQATPFDRPLVTPLRVAKSHEF